MTFIFRYTGTFDWPLIYRESRKFWERRAAQKYDFTEVQYQHKPKKMVIRWEINHKYDAYYMIKYKVNIRITMPKTVIVTENGVKKRMMRASLRCFTDFDWDAPFEQSSLAGEQQLFQGSWLQKIYHKITWRERWDLVDDIGMFTVNDYHELLKKLTGMHAGDYASIWEPG